jgi:superfamily II DNA or RNA helicase
MPYLTSKGRRSSKHSVKIAKELLELGEISIPRNFNSPVAHNKIDFTVDEMKVLIMQAADGSIIQNKSQNSIRINLKKERKKERARLLLKNANIEFKEKIQENGYSVFTYRFKCSLKDLSFLYLLNQEQLCSLVYDIIFWDGSNPNNDKFNYTGATFHGNYRDVTAVQYALSAALGKYVSINKDKRIYKNEDIYSCRVSSNNKSFIKTRRNDKAKSAEISLVDPEDGRHYCFETSTGFWLMRQNNQIYPTGNSGKSIIISKTAQELSKQGNVVISITITALLDQIASHLDMIGQSYSILKAGRESEFNPNEKIQLVQAHTLHARISKSPITASYYLQDEVHREYMTDRTRDILNFLKPKARIGYSGTCYDQAGFALEGAEMLQTTTVQDLQSQGYLCPIKYLIPKWSEQVDYSQVKSSGNDYNNVELEKIINSPEHLALVVKSMNEVDAKNKKTLVFCSSIEQADKVTEALVKAGYEAMSYHSKSDNSEEILDAFRNNTPFVKKPKKQKMKDLETGDLFADDMQFSSEPEVKEKYIKCLVSINRLGIGFDCPDVVLGVQLRPTLVRSLYIQQVMRLARKHESKQFSEYLDLAQTTSRFGFHDDDYVAPVRTGDKALDKKNMQEIDSKYALEDIAVVLQDTPVPIDRELYVAQIDAIKKSLKKNIEDMSFEELVKAYDLSKNHKEIITIATLVYTLKYGKPVSKAGYEYNYKPEQFWSESFFGKEEFHVLHDMQYYLDEFPHMQKQWIKSLKTRCRNIIRDELGLFRITGFIQFLRNKYVEEEMSEITSYSKKEDSSADEAVSYTKMNEMDFEVDDDEIPFSLSIAVPLASLSLCLEWCNMFI